MAVEESEEMQDCLDLCKERQLQQLQARPFVLQSVLPEAVRDSEGHASLEAIICCRKFTAGKLLGISSVFLQDADSQCSKQSSRNQNVQSQFPTELQK